MNQFMLINHHGVTCFCRRCRDNWVQRRRLDTSNPDYFRVQRIIEMSVLYRNGTEVFPTKRRDKLECAFEITKKQIINYKLYKDLCLFGTGEKYFKSWAKKQKLYEQYRGDGDFKVPEFIQHCQEVNDAAYVFENWEKITTNLTDFRVPHVDARTLGIQLLRRCSNMDWVIGYNEKVKPKAAILREPLYNREKINLIVKYAADIGILDDIGYNDVLAAAVGEQVQTGLISYCRRHTVQEMLDVNISTEDSLNGSM